MTVRVVCVLLFTSALLFAQSKQTPRPNPTPPPATAPVVITEEDLTYLRGRDLLIPVAGVSRAQLRNTYDDARSQGRQHNAIDIIAPQNTPVLAGVVIKLFQSDKGGITLYQLDPSGKYAYYYAHLARYADDMAEGKRLKRGEVLGYVGDTGNAGKGNYHLHFEVSKLAAPRKWYGGTPTNPYPLLIGK